ncbi:MAG: Holliday junction resolvase RuvX [Spirochaetota bacterium]
MILGVDYGTKRIGTALMHPEAGLAYPFEVITYASKSEAIERLLAVITKENVSHVVFGLPIHADGTDNDLCRSIRSLAAIIAREGAITTEFIDERLTSVEAERILAGKRSRKKKGNVDMLAAVLILEEYQRKK